MVAWNKVVVINLASSLRLCTSRNVKDGFQLWRDCLIGIPTKSRLANLRDVVSPKFDDRARRFQSTSSSRTQRAFSEFCRHLRRYADAKNSRGQILHIGGWEIRGRERRGGRDHEVDTGSPSSVRCAELQAPALCPLTARVTCDGFVRLASGCPWR
jgi:hypothetical protein